MERATETKDRKSYILFLYFRILAHFTTIFATSQEAKQIKSQLFFVSIENFCNLIAFNFLWICELITTVSRSESQLYTAKTSQHIAPNALKHRKFSGCGHVPIFHIDLLDLLWTIQFTVICHFNLIDFAILSLETWRIKFNFERKSLESRNWH